MASHFLFSTTLRTTPKVERIRRTSSSNDLRAARHAVPLRRRLSSSLGDLSLSCHTPVSFSPPSFFYFNHPADNNIYNYLEDDEEEEYEEDFLKLMDEEEEKRAYRWAPAENVAEARSKAMRAMVEWACAEELRSGTLHQAAHLFDTLLHQQPTSPSNFAQFAIAALVLSTKLSLDKTITKKRLRKEGAKHGITTDTVVRSERALAIALSFRLQAPDHEIFLRSDLQQTDDTAKKEVLLVARLLLDLFIPAREYVGLEGTRRATAAVLAGFEAIGNAEGGREAVHHASPYKIEEVREVANAMLRALEMERRKPASVILARHAIAAALLG